MRLKFQCGSLSLDKSEADAIAELGGVKELTVDIGQHIDPKLIDAHKLFTLSVEKNSPSLGQLALKVGVEKPSFTGKKPRKKTQKMIDEAVVESTVDECLGSLLSAKSARTVGAVMVLNALSKSNKARDIRSMATDLVDELDRQGLSSTSTCFRGFSFSTSRGWYPVMKKDDEGPTFHAGPMYSSLRDGLQWCVKHGLVSMFETITFGSNDKDLGKNAKILRRVVYKTTLTKRGEELIKGWADSFEYIKAFWDAKVAVRR